MYTFFVLGIIPGTTIQITFQLWLDVVAGLSIIILLARLLYVHRSESVVTAASIRLPLHARQLHLRAL